MNKKKCPYCGSFLVVKKGFQQGHQRWKCKSCSKKFQANKKALPSKEELFCKYVFNKQTLNELAQKYHIKTKHIQALMDEVKLPRKIHNPRSIALVVDTTFVGDYGVVVFRDQYTKENLWWRFVDSEQLIYYHMGREVLEQLGYTIVSVTADGLPGLPAVFTGIPFQFCHFHAKKNVTKYLTRNPQLQAGIELKEIMHSITSYNHNSFISVLNEWKHRHDDFLKEKTIHPDGSWSYTHKRLRSALRSMIRMSPFLFTYQNEHSITIPTTTNSLEGHFSHIKVRLKAHRGISEKRQQKMISAILLNSSVSFKENMHNYLL